MYLNRKGIVFGAKGTFSLDYTLSPIILSALLKFKECSADHKGIPGPLLCDMFPETLYDHTEEQYEQASTRWDEILDTMIYAFNLKNQPKIQDYAFTFNTNFSKMENERLTKCEITPTNEDEYERYKSDEKAHQEKVKEGHLLFGKYLSSLWW